VSRESEIRCGENSNTHPPNPHRDDPLDTPSPPIGDDMKPKKLTPGKVTPRKVIPNKCFPRKKVNFPGRVMLKKLNPSKNET